MSQSVLVRTPSTAVVTVVSQPFSSVVVRGVPGPRGPQGIPGPAGGATTVTVGAAPISGHTAVALDSGGLLVYADCTDPAHIGAVQGVVGNAYSPGDQAVVQTDFELVHAGWSFTPGPVLAGLSGHWFRPCPQAPCSPKSSALRWRRHASVSMFNPPLF